MEIAWIRRSLTFIIDADEGQRCEIHGRDGKNNVVTTAAPLMAPGPQPQSACRIIFDFSSVAYCLPAGVSKPAYRRKPTDRLARRFSGSKTIRARLLERGSALP
jgi:hypothetical protein